MIVPLGMWLLASGVAVLVAPVSPLVAIGMALAGGGTFGWLAARQMDPRRVRRRVHRRTPTESDALPPEEQPS